MSAKRKQKKQPDKKDKEPNLVLREKHGFFVKRNLVAFKERGYDNINELMSSVKEKEVKIDHSIVIQGIKNPLLSIYVGFSTRKMFEALLRKKKVVRRILIIEPNLGEFKHLLCTEDISDIILRDDVDFLIGTMGKELLSEVYLYFTKIETGYGVSRACFIKNNEVMIDPFIYDTEEKKKKAMDIINTIKDAEQQLQLSMGCSDDQFQRLELMIENREIMYNAWDMTKLKQRFQNIPALVIGGGPSVENFLEDYKKRASYYTNFIIIAADATLPLLLARGIRPHMVTRCERKLTTIFQNLTKEDTKGIYYCAYPWTPPEFFDIFDNHIYLFRHNGVCQFADPIKHYHCDGGVSSGNAALEIAMDLGCKNIYLAGIDLVMGDDGETHVKGTTVEFNIDNSKHLHKPIICNDGKKRTSIPVWERCQNEYMQSIDKHEKKEVNKKKCFKVYNLSPIGGVIRQAKPITYSEMHDMLGSHTDNTKTAHDIINKHKAKISKKDVDKFKTKLTTTLTELGEMKNLMSVAKGLIQGAVKTADREVSKLLRRIVEDSQDNAFAAIKTIRMNEANYIKVWKNVALAIDDNYKAKLYSFDTMRILILDILQLDMFQYENVTNSLYNEFTHEDERYCEYYKHTKDFMVRVDYYIDLLTEKLNEAVI